MVACLKRKSSPDLAYIYTPRESDLAPLVFLGGFRSDMMGTKAEFLSNLCEQQGRSYLRFDYSGHGQSGGDFEKCTLSDWLKDVQDILQSLEIKKPILIGSSMGGWLSLRLMQLSPDKVCGFIGIAAAPNFTRWMEDAMTDSQKQDMASQGYILLPNDYGAPYMISKELIADGRTHLMLDKDINFKGGVRLLQGKKDADVPWKTAEDIASALPFADVEIIYREEGNHSLSSEADLKALAEAIASLDKD